MENQSKLAARLELQSTISLVKSAQAKQAVGKPLTKREIAAVAELERHQQGESSNSKCTNGQLDVGAVVRVLVQLSSPEDESLIRQALGDVVVEGIPALAAIFDLSDATIRNGWARQGLPRHTVRGRGKRTTFRLADVLMWYLHREAAAGKGRRRQLTNGHADAAREELSAIEVESARLGLALRRAKVAELTGDLLSVSVCRSEIATVFTLLRDDILQIPRHIKPMLPNKLADRVTTEIDRLIRIDLTRISDQSQEQIIERVKENGNAHAGE
jgi:phage terminase Nu1 subunit (DNA packaging protein)